MIDNTKKGVYTGKYAAVAGLFLASGAVNAQIQYTDVSPDVVVDLLNTPYAIDLDGDMNADVQFNVATLVGSVSSYGVNYSGTYAAASAASGAGVIGISGGASGNPEVSALSFGNAIDSGAGFISGGILAIDLQLTGAVSTTVAAGNFVGATDMYVGVQFDVGGNTHYGWVRIDVSMDASKITIKDYAYNATSANSITAGDTDQNAGLEDVAIVNKVNFKVLLDEAVINVTPDLIGGDIALVDMAGNQVKRIAINGVDSTISYSGITTGVYMLVVNANGDNTSKRIYVR